MAAAGVEEDLAVQAARILLTLRSRRLLRWPEWVEKEPPATAVVEVRWPLEAWPTRKRGRRLPSDRWAAMVMPKLGPVAASSGSGASSSWEERELSPAPALWKERPRAGTPRDELTAPARRPESPACYVAPAVSGPSTSADRKPRPRHAADKASAAKEPVMKALSPETPLDFGADAAGSGASSGWDDAARPASKRRAPGAVGSGGGGGASSGDEGCSSPGKRARVADPGDGDKAIAEPKTQQAPDDGDKGVKFAFDLNMPCPEDDECPGF